MTVTGTTLTSRMSGPTPSPPDQTLLVLLWVLQTTEKKVSLPDVTVLSLCRGSSKTAVVPQPAARPIPLYTLPR